MEIKNNLLTFASASDIAKRKTKHNIMSKKNEQEYINELNEDILGVIRKLHEVSDNIDVLVEHIGHVKAVKATCEDVEETFTARHGLEDFMYYDYQEED